MNRCIARPRYLAWGLLLIAGSLLAIASLFLGWLVLDRGALGAIVGAGVGGGLLCVRSVGSKEGNQTPTAMEPGRVTALLALFQSPENRSMKRKEGSVVLAEQSEEAYQAEQAAWLAAVKRKREEKEGRG